MFRGIWKASPVLRRTTFAWWINPFRSWSQTRNSEKAWLSSSSSMASYHESTLCHSIFRSLPTENTTVSYTYIYIYIYVYTSSTSLRKRSEPPWALWASLDCQGSQWCAGSSCNRKYSLTRSTDTMLVSRSAAMRTTQFNAWVIDSA